MTTPRASASRGASFSRAGNRPSLKLALAPACLDYVIRNIKRHEDEGYLFVPEGKRAALTAAHPNGRCSAHRASAGAPRAVTFDALIVDRGIKAFFILLAQNAGSAEHEIADRIGADAVWAKAGLQAAIVGNLEAMSAKRTAQSRVEPPAQP